MNRTRSGGFTLFEIVVVLLVVGVIVAMAATIARGVTAAKRRSLTATRIATVDAALVSYVSQQKRLPCPADGTLASSNANAGKENGRTAAGCSVASLTNGVVPWRDLGLTETDATDGWDRRLTYRVQPGLAADNAMDMSWCDPAGSEVGATPRACNNACTSTALASCTPPSGYLTGRGLKVKNVAGTTHMDPAVTPHTGAGYIVISHGESGGGGYLSTGILATSSLTDGTEEAKNYANVAYDAVNSYWVDDVANDTSGASHFDDVVSRPSLLNVIAKAGLGPRAHN